MATTRKNDRRSAAKGMAAVAALVAWAMVGNMANAADVTTETLLREMMDRDAVARIPSPYYVCKQASSWDRSQTEVGGKNWFANHDYDQYLRKETVEGRTEFVVMEDEGPGCVTRIWKPLDIGNDLPRLTIRFYLDGQAKPAIEEDFTKLLSAQSIFREPFSFIASDEKDSKNQIALPPGYKQLGGDLYFPVPYADGCKITLEPRYEPGTTKKHNVFFYIINYRSYEKGASVETFSASRHEAVKALARQIGGRLNAPGTDLGVKTTVGEAGTLKPGESLSVKLPAGPAAVRKFVVKLEPNTPAAAFRALAVTMSFDGERTVWCPMAEFFGGGYFPGDAHPEKPEPDGCFIRPHWNWNRRVEKDGTFSCYFVMPYQSDATVGIRNTGAAAVPVKISVGVGSWTWNERSLAFHADWRSGKTPGKPYDWNYVEIQGQGAYVADTLSVYNPGKGWYGEGDERIYIDGESFPSHLGTGTEDYYGYAWGMANFWDSAFISAPSRDARGKNNWSGYQTVSRERMLDAIPFRSSLKVDMEVGVWNPVKATYAVGTMWYGAQGAKASHATDTSEAPTERRYVEGAGSSRAARLEGGGFINMGPTPDLDLPRTSIELVYRLDRAPGPGYNPCLIAKRDGRATRFSLHVMQDLSQLVVWNGSAPTIFPAPGGKLATGTWHHTLLTWQGDEMCLYLDGVSLGKARGTFNAQAKRLPLLIGASSLTGGEWCDASVDEVAVYNRVLTPEEAAAHAAPIGKQLALAESYAPVVAATPGLVASWRMEGNMKPAHGTHTGTFVRDVPSSSRHLSLLSSQLGYQTESGKRAYVRDLDRDRLEDDTDFTVYHAETDEIVYRAQTSYWGEKWRSHWWVLDFSALKVPGKYYVRIGSAKSNPFFIGKTPLMDFDMVDIALNQLDERHNHGEPNTYLNGKLRFHGRWMTPDGKHPRGIYRDCMSNYAEIESIGLTTMGLITLYRYQKETFSEEDQKRIQDYITLGADYIVACQRKTDDPKTNGRFCHSLLVNTKHDGCGWAGNVYNWHDMAYAMVVLCKSYEAVKPFDPARAQTYLNAAKLAYTCASHRPYHLQEEYELAKRDDNYDPIKDYDKARWTPELNEFRTDPKRIPVGWNNPHQYARLFYDKKAPWKEPTTLKTREKLPFLHGCALLYRITGEKEYLDTAVEFADSIQERQFTDWRKPIEGVYGTFYEFEGDNRAFSLESGQAGGHFMGHIDALNVNGFIELLRLVPDHPGAANWRNVVHTYADNYVKRSAELNPLGIHPLGVFSHPQYGGVKFFQQVMHGATGHYGQMAENILALADFLNDSSLHRLAEANLHFYTGSNPGIPQKKGGGWKAATLINRVGPSFYNTGGEGIKGGVINGFKAGKNWVLAPVSAVPDAPDIAGGQEDWVAHSHPYVGAAARMEAPFTLCVITTDGGKPVSATVLLRLPDVREHQTGPHGAVTIVGAPVNRSGTLSVHHGKETITRKLDTIAGGSLTWNVDFAQHAEVSLDVPEQLGLDAEGQIMIKVSNLGGGSMAGQILLSVSGATLGTSALDIEVASGESKEFTVGCRGGDRVMPYLVTAALKTDRGIVATSSRQGLVGSD